MPELAIAIELSPDFHDLDPLDIVWHGHYVKYLERARCALLSRHDYDYPQMRESGYAWPVVDLHIHYAAPAAYAQRLRVSARIIEWEHRLRIRYEIRDAQTGRRLTRATTTQVAVNIATRELCLVCPPVLWERLGVQP